MNRRKWLWAILLALPTTVAGVLFANSQTRPYTCPLTGEQLPCEKCCPLNKQQDQKVGYTCPVTGEQLPCENCCPLNQQK